MIFCGFGIFFSKTVRQTAWKWLVFLYPALNSITINQSPFLFSIGKQNGLCFVQTDTYLRWVLLTRFGSFLTAQLFDFSVSPWPAFLLLDSVSQLLFVWAKKESENLHSSLFRKHSFRKFFKLALSNYPVKRQCRIKSIYAGEVGVTFVMPFAARTFGSSLRLV